MIVEEIVLKKNEDDKRDKIQKNLGKEVILNDNHNRWMHGVLLIGGNDSGVYQIKILHTNEKKQLHYHDLNQLLVLNPYRLR